MVTRRAPSRSGSGRQESAEIAPPLAEVLRTLPPRKRCRRSRRRAGGDGDCGPSDVRRPTDSCGGDGDQPALAGRCASQPEILAKLGPALLDELRGALVGRSREREADLRSASSGAALGPPATRARAAQRTSRGYLLPPLRRFRPAVPDRRGRAVEYSEITSGPHAAP